MIEKELEKVKGQKKEGKFKNQAQKIEIQWEIQESHKCGINFTGQNAPYGYDACGTATTH